MMAFFGDSNLVVALSFVLFLGVLVWQGVPGKIGAMLDARAERIRKELDDARRLREEAQALLAGYERKQKEVAELAQEIVTRAKSDAARAAEEGRAELERSIERRLRAAEDRIASAEAAAIREVKDRAVTVAVRAATQVIAAKAESSATDPFGDEAIRTVAARLN